MDFSTNFAQISNTYRESAIFATLKGFRSDIDVSEVNHKGTVIFDHNLKRFCSPERNRLIYNYVSYGLFFDTTYNMRNRISDIFSFHFYSNSTDYDVHQVELKDRIIRECKAFHSDIRSSDEVSAYSSEIESTLLAINKSTEILSQTSNSKNFMDLWIQEIKKLEGVLNYEKSKIPDLYLIDDKLYDVIKRLLFLHTQTANVHIYNDDHPLCVGFWSIDKEIMLRLLNNDEKINKRLLELVLNERCSDKDVRLQIDQNFWCSFSTMMMNISCIIYYKFRSLIDKGDKDEMASFLDFLDNVTNQKHTSSVKNTDDYNIVITLLDEKKYRELLDSIVNLTDIQLIKNTDKIRTLERIGRCFKDTSLVRSIAKLFKRQRRGDLDTNNNPRKIMSIHFKDPLVYKNSNDYLDLTQEQEVHLQNYLNSTGETDNVTFYRGDRRVFRLESVPGIMFKTFQIGSKEFRRRIRNHAFARALVSHYNLDLIIVPRFGHTSIGNTAVIYEEMCDVDPSHYVQEELYEKYTSRMENSIRQLTIFCCLTGLDDVVWRNIPLDNSSLKSCTGDVKIVLVDLGEMTSFKNSVFGGAFGRVGLIRSIDTSLFDVVKKTFEEIVGPKYEDQFEEVCKIRDDEIRVNNNLKKYFADKGITHANKFQKVTVDRTKLNFSDYDTEDQNVLLDLSESLVDSFNHYLDAMSVSTSDLQHNNIYRMSLKLSRNISMEKECLRYTIVRVSRSGHSYDAMSLARNFHVSLTKEVRTIKQKNSPEMLYDVDTDTRTYLSVAAAELIRTGVIFSYDESSLIALV